MSDDLPTEYDVIVLGTGMVECIFAAACARIGKSVLHLDRNGYYGGDWASFNLDQFQKLMKSEEIEVKRRADARDIELKEGESLLTCSQMKTILNASETIHIKLCHDTKDGDLPKNCSFEPIANCGEIDRSADLSVSGTMEGVSEAIDGESSSKCVTTEPETSKFENKMMKDKKDPCWEDVFKHFRKFNLDIAPKLLFSRGELVELLVSSNVARYAEYKCLTRVLTHTDKLVQVPCSRSDVFSTKDISVVDKRMLMKLLNFILDCDLKSQEITELKSQVFGEFLKKRKISKQICDYVINAIAMVPASSSVEAGLRSAKKFLHSLGRFGNTPFLWPMYGSGELPQCFCRLCAVFGGIYFLRRFAESIIINEEQLCCGVISEGQRFNCKVLACDSTYVPAEYIPEDIETNKVSRAVLITKDSLIPSTKEQISLLRLPPTDSHKVISLLELSPGSMVCPEGMHVVHLTSESSNETAEKDLKQTVENFFDNLPRNDPSARPELIYSAYFNVIDTTKCDLNSKTPENVFVASNSGSDLDFDRSVVEARKLFSLAFPDNEFLPRAPDPDEIIFDHPEQPDTEESGGLSEKCSEENMKSNENLVSEFQEVLQITPSAHENVADINVTPSNEEGMVRKNEVDELLDDTDTITP